MSNPFFDGYKYPWSRDDARALHEALYGMRALNTMAAIRGLYEACGENLLPLTEGNPVDVWREALDKLARARRIEVFCQLILQSDAYAPLHDAARAVQEAKDVIDHFILSDDLLFLDRQQLRDKLQRVTKSRSRRVLLVRGGAKCGKSWTKYMIDDLAASRGEQCTYLSEDSVKKLSDALEHLFLRIGGAGAKVPAPMETEEAWYQKICRELTTHAEKSGPWWIVVDDLGVDANGPRFDPQIKTFFDQFALAMTDPSFAKWFRLVLIDYPEGRVPTRWKAEFWDEDRPDASHLDAAAISRFVIDWAQRQKKRLGANDAERFAQQVIATANAAADPEKSRLQLIYDAIEAALETL